MLKSQGATVYVFARRPEIKAEIVLDGFNSIELDEIKKIKPFVIFNTIPQEIFLDKIEAYKIELASTNGFRYSDGVINGRGLPGKMFPKAAAEILYYTIKPILTAREKA